MILGNLFAKHLEKLFLQAKDLINRIAILLALNISEILCKRTLQNFELLAHVY